MAGDLTHALPGPSVPSGRRGRGLRLAVLILGIAFIVAGVALIAGPLYTVWQRGNTDQAAITDWQKAGSTNLVGPPTRAGVGGVAPVQSCGSSAPNDDALVVFASLSQYGYAGVAGDGDWSSLDTRSMVHYHGSPEPGQTGNVIIAFHREPNFQHIDAMGVGATLTVQDRSCHVWTYRVTQVWTLAPKDVTQLVATTGHDLTLITCTPWWVDSQRIVWRATLVSG
jgi:LPXTG-site transpeptidase (sortase) family protein